jgi:hypothetical protein
MIILKKFDWELSKNLTIFQIGIGFLNDLAIKKRQDFNKGIKHRIIPMLFGFYQDFCPKLNISSCF